MYNIFSIYSQNLSTFINRGGMAQWVARLTQS